MCFVGEPILKKKDCFKVFKCCAEASMKCWVWNITGIHHGRLTWNIIMEVWKIIFLSKWVICRFHVNFPGCIGLKGWVAHPLVVVILIRGDMRWYSV